MLFSSSLQWDDSYELKDVYQNVDMLHVTLHIKTAAPQRALLLFHALT